MADEQDETNGALDRDAIEMWNLPGAEREIALVSHYTPFVKRCVSMAVGDNPNLERDDAMQEALMRLVICIRKFDPTRGAQFTTYATMPVTYGTLDAARNEDWVPAKARAADRETNELPVMFAMDPSLDADDEEDALQSIKFDIAEMLAAIPGTHVERAINDMLGCDWDYELLAEKWGVTVYSAIYTVKEAWKELRDIPAYKRKVADQRSLPEYMPPPPGTAMSQQVMFADGAA